jgi:hypothetical protein
MPGGVDKQYIGFASTLRTSSDVRSIFGISASVFNRNREPQLLHRFRQFQV